MKKLLSILLLFTLFLSAQSYESQWKEVQKFEKKSLPKSSLKKVEEILQQAKNDKNEIQFIKALLYKEKYLFQLSEERYVTVIHDIERAISQTSNRNSQLILTSILAQFYAQYLQKSRYSSKRTPIKDNLNQDIRTWSLEKLSKKVMKLYLNSLDKISQKVDISYYSSILNKSKNVSSLRPTLYDFLAFRALNYFRTAEGYDSFTIEDIDAFSSAYTFMYLAINPQNPNSYGYQSWLIYQELLKFHQAYHHKRALDYVDVERLKFVKQYAIIPNRDMLYIQALKEMVSKNPKSEALLELARYYQNSGEFVQAMQYAKEGMKSSDRYIFSSSQKIKNSITRRELAFEIEKVNLPDENILSRVSYRNGHELFIKVIKLTPDEREKFTQKNYRDRLEYIKSLHPFKKIKINLPKTDDYKKHSTEISLEQYKIGTYLFIFSFQQGINKHSVYKIVNVSNIAYMQQGQKKLLVMNRKTGQPLSGVKSYFYETHYNSNRRVQENKLRYTIKSDENGEIAIPKLKENYFVIFEYKKDRLDLRAYNYYRIYQEEKRDKGYNFVKFFTDRAIYRPNQTIYFKGLAIQNFNHKAPKVLKNKKVKVSFFNVNNQLIENKIFTTNEFGSFSGTLLAPQNGLLGSMRIQADIGGATRVQVEEYKQPKFEVMFKPLEKSYSLEDSIQITGEAKAFSGAKIDGAKVKYRVTRKTSFPWIPWWQQRSLHQSYEKEIATGTIQTDATGQFKIQFQAVVDKKIDVKERPNYTYKVSVDVTDTTGETHSEVKSILLGYVGIGLDIEIASELNQEQDKKMIIKSTNLDGEFQPIQGEILVEKILPEERVYRNRYWNEIDKPLYSKEEFNKRFNAYRYSKNNKRDEKRELIKTILFDTQTDKEVSLNELEQGKYRLTVKTFDQKGMEVSKTKEIVIYDLKSKETPTTTYLWQKIDKKNYDTLPTNCKLYLKSSLKNLPVLFTVERNGEITQERWIKINRVEMELIKVTKKDRGNIHYQLNFIQNNRPYTQKGTITIPWNNQLNIEFISFRDKLKPNEEEQWKVKISGKNKEKVMAEMVATIYDASLEQFRKLYYNNLSYLFPTFNPRYVNQWQPQHFVPVSARTSWQSPQNSSISRVFPTLTWPINNYRDYSRGVPLELEALPMPSPVAEPSPMSNTYSVQAEESGRGGDIILSDTEDKEISKKEQKRPPLTIRKDFNETLLFKPHLQTDKEGNIIINFKTNEALTRWKFLAFAHTKDLRTAVASKTFTTAKELMVITNLPRFFREKDTITLSTKVVNTTNHTLNGTCELQLINPITQKPIFKQEFKKPFSIGKERSTTIEFTFKVPDIDRVSAIQHTFIARTSTHTDAEQTIKPILSNRIFLTESKVLSINANEEKTFTLESLKNNHSSTLKNHKLTLEFTSNPAWYAIQSLPYLMEYEHECSEQLFSRYYANALAENIIRKKPKIKAIFDTWKENNQPISKLVKNQELKSILLEETPWVLASQTQEQQEKNIALLFDLYKLAQEQNKALKKLEKRQLKDGGWSWFGGNHANWYITQYIVEGIGHLKALGIEEPAMPILSKALSFIDKKIVEKYKLLLELADKGYRRLEDDNLNSISIHYLYARSFFQEKMDTQTQKAFNYYLNQAKKFWTTKGIYEKGLIALTLNRLNEPSADIVASLKEHAIESDELGIYFKYPNGYYWNRLPVETHSLMIELFEQVAEDKKMVEGLKIWLLKQRQTTHWKTTKATSSAIYALLSTGNWLESNKLVEVAFESDKDYQEKVKRAQQKAIKGLGYYKVAFNAHEFDNSMATISVKNPNNTIAWGGLYWQYFEDMNRVKTFKETPLKISKQLYLTQNTPTGEALVLIQNQGLHVGDKVKVRIEIRADRDMEYIMLKDSRASTFEPLNVISQYKWQDGLSYYQSTKDNATYFFIEYLNRGTYIFEYPLVVTHKGEFSNGITTIESIYAPEYKSHSQGAEISVW